MVLNSVMRISSREVAEMMEVSHGNLVRKIEGINDDFREIKIDFSEYWIESAYKVEGNNKSYKHYLLSKQGCEFLAHKTTGTKGNLFTHKYMKRFQEMENQLKSQVPQLTKKQQLQLAILNGNDLERVSSLKEYETLVISEATQPLIETLEVQAPKVEYHDTVLNSSKLITATDVAKDLGISARKLNHLLSEKGVIFKRNNTWHLYARYQHLVPNYFDYHITEFGQLLKFTEKGRQFIIDLLGEELGFEY